MSKPKLFISYSRKDAEYLDEFKSHISSLLRNEQIELWTDTEIIPGKVWEDTLKKQLEESDIIIFLVSPDFIASDFIYDVEILKAIERHEKGQLIIVPIIIRPCDFTSLPISKFQALPRNAQPISKWADKDEAWLDALTGLKRVLTNWNEDKFQLNKKSNLDSESSIFEKVDLSNIKLKIAEGKTKDAISELLKITKEKDNGIYNSLIMQSSKYNRLKNDSLNGLLSSDQQRISTARIEDALLEILDELNVD